VACFTGTPYDERQYAKLVVDHTGMVPYYLDVDDNQALRDIERIIFDQEGIYWFARVGPWALYRAMRFAGIRVSIDGHGSDELIGGYHFYVERALDEAAESLDLKRYLDLRGVLSGLVGGTESSRYGGFLGALRLLARRVHLLEPARALLAGSRSLQLRVRDNTSGRSAEILPGRVNGPNRLYYDAADARVTGMSPLQATLFSSFHGSMLPTLLCNFDRASMSHGIEVRMPFMDWRLVTYSFGLPDTSKIGGGYTKRVLRQAMRGILPEPIRLRTKKIGFVSPMEAWTRGALKLWLLDLSASRSFIESTVWNGRAARAAVERAVDGKASIDPVWPVLNAYVLEQSFKGRARNAKLTESAGCLRSPSLT
jgi:asparagine synthase (glutamine-hydrolysing)